MVEHNTNGPRLYVHGLRVHHGLTGSALVAVGLLTHERALVGCGLALVAHDAHDFPWRLRERAVTPGR